MSPFQAALNDQTQYALNWERQRQEGYGTYLGRNQSSDIPMPIILYDEAWEKNPRLLIDLLRRASDYMLLNKSMLYSFDNPNQRYMRDVVAGKLRIDDYLAAERLFGEAGAIPVTDNHFFDSTLKLLIGKLLEHPFEFAVNQINTEFSREQILDAAKTGAKMLMQTMLEGATQSGMNMDFARDKSVRLPKDQKELLNYMNGQEQVESIMYKLLQNIHYNHSLQEVGAAAFRHKFEINAQFGMVDVVNREIIPRVLDPDQVGWIATKQIKTFEDPNLIAACVNDYMNPQELVNEFGVGLNTGTGIRGVYSYLENIIKLGRNRIGYSPEMNYWSDYGISEWGVGSDLLDHRIQGYTLKQVNWMNSAFYPGFKSVQGMMVNILVQKGFCKIVRNRRYKVVRVGDGADRPATDRELEAYQTSNLNRQIDLQFVPVDESAGENLNRQNIKKYPRVELYSWKRIGHDAFIDVGPYKYQADPNGENKGYVGMPIVAQISYEKSMAKLGEHDAIRVNVLYKLIDEYLARMGVSDVLIIDDAQEGEPIEYLYNAKKSGTGHIDSTLMQPNNAAQLKHLTTIKLSNHTEELRLAFDLIRELTSGYRARCGVSDEMQGQAQKYDGLKKTQLNIMNQQLLLTQSLYEHNQFMNQMLQREADIAKIRYGYDGEMNVRLSDNERKVLRLTHKLRSADFGLYLESGQVIANRLELIQGLIQSMAQSGGAIEYEAMAAGMTTQNPAEAMAIFKRLKQETQEREQQLENARNAIQQQTNEVELQKLNIALEKERMQTIREVTLKQMDMQMKGQAMDAQGLQADIQASNALQQQVLGSALEQQATEEQPQPTQ